MRMTLIYSPFNIEAPRRKQRGTEFTSSAKPIFDPDKTCFICSLTPPQAAGNRVYELGDFVGRSPKKSGRSSKPMRSQGFRNPSCS